jgi:hypothetical protein
MPVACPKCGQPLPESKGGSEPAACPRCGNPINLAATLPFANPAAGATRESKSSGGGRLADGKAYSLVILHGKNPGQVIPLQKARVVIGRVQCDVNLDDAEISRQHALLEIRGSEAQVEDLGSTNGVHVEGERVERARLEDRSEFRVGSHQLMFVVTDRPAEPS